MGSNGTPVVRLPLATSNRHGLIAGATGTGKTRTLQLLAEQLSEAGVSVFAADYKGDVSGLVVPGPADRWAAERMADLGLPHEPASYPAELSLRPRGAAHEPRHRRSGGDRARREGRADAGQEEIVRGMFGMLRKQL